MSRGLASQWREALALERRKAPELYISIEEVEAGPHEQALRLALGELGLTAVFCIEGVPTIAFLNENEVSLERIDRLHHILWNQGLMSLLLVIGDDEMTA